MGHHRARAWPRSRLAAAAARARSICRRTPRSRRGSRPPTDTEAERAAQPGVFNPTYGSDGRPDRAQRQQEILHPRSAAAATEPAMNHFDYRNGVLHAEAVNLSELADAVGTPFYCYSTATLERHYRVFTEAFAGEKALVCYAMKANSNQSVLRTLAKLGAGADVVSGGELKRALAAGIPPQQDPVLRRRQDRSRAARGAGRRHPLHQRRIRAGARTAVAARGRGRQDRADLGAGQSRRRCRHPRQDLHRQVREQVRHPDRAGPRGLCPRRKAAGHRGHRRRHAYRQPDHRSRQDGNRVPDPGRFRARRCAPTATPSRISISAAASAFPITWTARRRRRRPPMPRWSSA